ncbi:hypothetical protein [Alkalihalobacillus sp. BA299]|uniref:hypothetical protein n=1 Tax=Alkalihalobacillus sp. BA299 TaxID=2815938 RepID=UPI001ADB4970|nr:hypothetical protein [Alkalihalobacillus sp. BA299]
MTKIILIFVFFSIIMAAFLIFIDLFVGIPFSKSINNVRNPFWVMDVGELSILVILIMISVAIPIKYYFKLFTKKKN